ncbi:hypothetical protein EVJ27_13650 [Exiguobacterium sp. SH3S2]|uniref:hypothetical protein n=1 Tax=unclassified Exiguobacterium TaxID=2644629 RepID=UPI00103C2F5E|nr:MULTISPECIES: hypothetical protein [unclassified Exiguobacterium]TCI41550.1 hypothetical protein EVJ28_13705 [Exiguobacterium sp. SH3S3]TCI58188.1 hypothetical protein EVJ27_13650 [Exiguobacterium sp. SH3S2]
MNREEAIQLLEKVKANQQLLEQKEEILYAMRMLAIEALKVDQSKRLTLDRSFQEMKQQLVYLESKNEDSFH